ncbi:MAG: thiamine-phosphate kinase [Bacteroidales bacterium]|nr:thiamine-phosphate kinase [Bacteroidales bacterium]
MDKNKTDNKTELADLGEFGLIKRLTENIQLRNNQTVMGVGDDACVLEYSEEQLVVTNDLLIEGVHFDLGYTPLMHLGYKAVVVNVSDVLAMNAFPKQVLVSIAVSNRFGLEAIEELYKGIHLACKDYGVDLVGGDTSSSTKGLFLSITAIGSAPKERIVYRSGAGLNDILCVSGDLGGAYMGLQLLERENQIFRADPNIQPDLSGNDYVLQRQLRPQARIDIITFLKKQDIIPSSMIDISDGLSSEAIHLCLNSGLGCKIFEDKIPIAMETDSLAEEFGIESAVCALNGGEDYELLFSIKPADYEKIKSNPSISAIGHFTDKAEGMSVVGKNGAKIPLNAQGWNAFLNKK